MYIYVYSSDKQSRDEPNLVHRLHDPNLMQPDQLQNGPKLVHSSDKQAAAGLCDFGNPKSHTGCQPKGVEPKLVHNSHDTNLMQPDQLHVEDGPNLVRYFEKLVRDEVSSSGPLHDLSDPNLMQPSQFNTGETLQDCIDFDEFMNVFHSTAASAQLLRQSLSEYGNSDLQRDSSHLGFLANSSDQTTSSTHSQGN